MRKPILFSYEINSLIFLNTYKFFQNLLIILKCSLSIFFKAYNYVINHSITQKILDSYVKSCYENTSKIREFSANQNVRKFCKIYMDYKNPTNLFPMKQSFLFNY